MRIMNVGIGMLLALLMSTVLAADASYQKEEIKLVINGVAVTLISKETLLHDGKSTRYTVANLVDGDMQTAWVTRYSNNDYLYGRLKIVFDKPVYVKKLKLANGYQKNDITYQENQRVKTLGVHTLDMMPSGFEEPTSYDLKDIPDWQEIDIGSSTDLFATKSIVIDITDSYPGSKYQDICLSEISVTYADKSGYEPTQQWDELKVKILANRTVTERGWYWENLYAANSEDLTDWWDFLFYVLSGNEDAYDLFMSIYPQGTMESELIQNVYIPSINAQLGISNDKE